MLAAKRSGGRSGVVLWGGGSPKNFMLQTEPQIQEVLRIKEYGQDFFIQVTDARPDTGGLSGATPSEAVSWGKVDPTKLPDAIVCYTDTTIAMPLLCRHISSEQDYFDRKEVLTKEISGFVRKFSGNHARLQVSEPLKGHMLHPCSDPKTLACRLVIHCFPSCVMRR